MSEKKKEFGLEPLLGPPEVKPVEPQRTPGFFNGPIISQGIVMCHSEEIGNTIQAAAGTILLPGMMVRVQFAIQRLA